MPKLFHVSNLFTQNVSLPKGVQPLAPPNSGRAYLFLVSSGKSKIFLLVYNFPLVNLFQCHGRQLKKNHESAVHH